MTEHDQHKEELEITTRPGHLSRREFLKAAAMAAALAAAGCAPTPPPPSPTSKPTESPAKPVSPPAPQPTAQPVAAGETWNKGVCRYCGTGCGVMLGTQGGKLVAVQGDKDNPVNRGLLCPKAFYLPTALYADGRATRPLIRKDGKFVEASWDEALDLVANKFMETLNKYGHESIAYYGSGQLYTEESYIANKLFKGGLGTNNVDGNPRLCMASAVGGYVTTYGKDEPMGAYDDIEQAECLFIIGSNTAEAHPIIFQRVANHKQKNPGVKVIMADPRVTPSTKVADLHLSFVPGTDLALLNAMAKVIIEERLVDEGFIAKNVVFMQGDKAISYDDYKKFLSTYTEDSVAKTTGIPAEKIREAAITFGKAKTATSMWTMGLNQRIRGVWANNLVHNLHLLTGKIGKPGSTPLSLTGQPNACGGVRDPGVLAHLLPAGRIIENDKHREEIEKLWGTRPGAIKPKQGFHTIEMFNGLTNGKVKAVLIMCTNPLHSLPNLNKYVEGIKKSKPFMVVADAYFPTKTTELADVVLPAATWVEKGGIFANAERRYQYTPKVIDPPGEAKSDFWILLELAKRWGLGDYIKFKTPEDAFKEYTEATRGTAYEMMGITYERLKQERGLQWPCPSPNHPGTVRRYVKGDPLAKPDKEIDFYGRPNGKAVVWARPSEAPAEPADAEYPFVLTTGRLLEQWHTGTMTMKVPDLKRAVPNGWVEINPADANKLGIRDRDMVKLTSRRGTLVTEARVVERPMPGVIFGHMHDENRLINILTIDAFDPASRQPEFKVCGVKIAKA